MDEKTLRVTAYFTNPELFQEAAAELTRSGHKPDCFLPWPLHGLDANLGLKRSWIGRPVLAIILIGMAIGLHLCWFTQVQDYPLNVGGKPFFAWPTFVVVILETGLLGGALVNMALALHTSKLMPDPGTRLINDRITDDLFCLVVPVLPLEQPQHIVDRLVTIGAEQVEVQGSAYAEERRPAHA